MYKYFVDSITHILSGDYVCISSHFKLCHSNFLYFSFVYDYFISSTIYWCNIPWQGSLLSTGAIHSIAVYGESSGSQVSVRPACGRHDMPVLYSRPSLMSGHCIIMMLCPLILFSVIFLWIIFSPLAPFWKVPSSFVIRNKTMDLIMDCFCSFGSYIKAFYYNVI